MNPHDSRRATVERKKKILPSAALALAIGLVSMFGSAAMASDPIPGVDVKLGKNPGGIISVPTDGAGRFTLRVTEPGQYKVWTECRPQSTCPAHALTVNATGAQRRPGTSGAMAYEFTVAPGAPAFVLSGEIASRVGGVAKPTAGQSMNTTGSNTKK